MASVHISSKTTNPYSVIKDLGTVQVRGLLEKSNIAIGHLSKKWLPTEVGQNVAYRSMSNACLLN